jgi:hypothetical protein
MRTRRQHAPNETLLKQSEGKRLRMKATSLTLARSRFFMSESDLRYWYTESSIFP